MSLKIKLDRAEELVTLTIKSGLVANMLSSPGVGKSGIAQQIAKKNQLQLIDVRLSQMDASDLLGFPFILNKDAPANKIKAGYVPMNVFPIAGDPLPEGKRGWLILLDEFNSAPLSVQAAAYKIVLDRMVGMHPLHRNVAIITAGNLATDKAIVNRLSTAMQSRMVHFELLVCPDVWDVWAVETGIDHRVRSFIKFKPGALHIFDPSHSDLTFPCPRTWEFISKLIKKIEDVEVKHLPLLAGTIGEGMAREFYSYTQIFDQIPTIAQIIANPEGVRFKDEPGIHYALTGLVGHHINTDNIAPLMKFVERLAIDFQVVCIRSAIARDRDLMQAIALKAWISRNASELV